LSYRVQELRNITSASNFDVSGINGVLIVYERQGAQRLGGMERRSVDRKEDEDASVNVLEHLRNQVL
jgi:hypothetical protein